MFIQIACIEPHSGHHNGHHSGHNFVGRHSVHHVGHKCGHNFDEIESKQPLETEAGRSQHGEKLQAWATAASQNQKVLPNRSNLLRFRRYLGKPPQFDEPRPLAGTTGPETLNFAPKMGPKIPKVDLKIS